MKSRKTEQMRVLPGTWRATSTRWLHLSLVVLSLALLALSSVQPAAAADKASQQMEFGADMARRGLWSEALFRFQQANRLEPGNGRILNNVAVAYEALGLFDKALEAYREGLAATPSDRELRENYSNFVEFYQNFRPRPDDGEPEAESSAESTPAAKESR